MGFLAKVRIQNQLSSFLLKGNKVSAEGNCRFYCEEVIAIKNKIHQYVQHTSWMWAHKETACQFVAHICDLLPSAQSTLEAEALRLWNQTLLPSTSIQSPLPPWLLYLLRARQGQNLLSCSSFSTAGKDFCPFATLETNIPQHRNPKWWRKKSCYKKAHDLSKSRVWSRVTALQGPVTERSSWQNHPTSMGFDSTGSWRVGSSNHDCRQSKTC